MMDLDLRRRFFAEELEAVCKLRSSSLVDAFAAVPREAFLPPGPWVVLADADFGAGPVKTRQTPDADPAMGNIGKGLVFLVNRASDDGFAARVTGFVAIYSAVGIRDAWLNDRLGMQMMAGPQQWQTVTRLRRDAHDPTPACWLHGPSFCLSTQN